MAIPKRSPGGTADVPSLTGSSPDLLTLCNWLTDPKFDDGTPRKLPSVTFWVEGGRVKACLNDKAERLSGFVTLSGLEMLGEQLSDLLAMGKVDWRDARK